MTATPRTVRPLKPHGTPARAKGRPGTIPPCDCEPCITARREYGRKRATLQALGRPGRLPATLAAEHVRKLLATGMTWTEVTQATGISRGALRNLLQDGARITITTQMRVLATPIPGASTPAPRTIDATGTRRRIQALMRIGWTCKALAPEIGVSSARVWQLSTAENVTDATAARVLAAYRRLENTPGPSTQTASYARNKGWARPIEWDDDEIDNPNAQPRLARRADTKPAKGCAVTDDELEDLDWILRTEEHDTGTCDGRARIGARLGVTEHRVEYMLGKLKARQRIGVAA